MLLEFCCKWFLGSLVLLYIEVYTGEMNPFTCFGNAWEIVVANHQESNCLRTPPSLGRTNSVYMSMVALGLIRCAQETIFTCEQSRKSWYKLLKEREDWWGHQNCALRQERIGSRYIPCLRTLDKDWSWGTLGSSTWFLLTWYHAGCADSSSSSCVVRCRNPHGRWSIFLLQYSH